jgi:serine/threonine protein kinase
MEREACLGVDTIVALVEGRGDRARIEAHAARCEACRGELSALARAGDPTPVDRPRRVRAITEPSQIGRYELRELLGAGGMGVVFAAYDAELARTVAVKVLRPGLGAAMADRLRREAQAMARLAHPNVVAVYDAGVDRGRTFVAMERVDGETLTRWLEAPRSPREILDAFRAAGAGLAAAHAAGLVHRDFKPDNVLVGRDGRIRVGDFGLVRTAPDDGAAETTADGDVRPADRPVRSTDRDVRSTDRPVRSTDRPVRSTDRPVRSTDRDVRTTDEHVRRADSAADASREDDVADARWADRAAEAPRADAGLTASGVVLGTPAYMAPEQHRGEPADARSDQFSFCVALHRALYGSWPFAGATIEALAIAVQAGARVPPAHQVRLPRRVRAAIARGLATDPAARFATLDALLAELAPRPARWLAAALPAAAIAVAVLATRGAAPTPCGGEPLRDAWGPARKLQIAAAIAGTGAPFAPATVREVTRAGDAYAAAWTAMATEVCEATRDRAQPEDLLGRRVACLAGHRRALAALADQLATADRGVAEHAALAIAGLPALDACGDLIALGAPVPPPAPGQAAGVAALRDRLAEVRALRDTGRWPAGLAAIRPLLARAEAIGYRPLEAEAFGLAGALAGDTGAYGEAAPWLERAALAGEAGRDDHAAARARIAALDVRAKAAPADDLAALEARARAALERLGAPAELDAELRLTIGARAATAGHIAAATRELAAAIAILERHHGADDLRLARPLRTLGGAYARGSDVAHALPPLERALAIQRRALGDDHPEVAITLEVLGTAAYMAARYDEAAARFEAAQAIAERALGPASFRVAELLAWRAQTDGYRGRLDEAIALHRRAIAIDERALGRQHPTTLSHLDGLAMALEQRARYPEALAVAGDTLARMRAALGADDRRIADALQTVALIELDLRRFAAARDHAEQSRAMFERVMGGAFRPFAQLRTIGEAWLGLGDPARAAVALEAARRGLSATADPEDRLWIEALLGRALYDAGRDRPRARALIASSWRALADDDQLIDERDQLARWMAARGLRPPRSARGGLAD